MSDDDECDDIAVHMDSSPAMSNPGDTIPSGTDDRVKMKHTHRVAVGILIVPHESNNEPEEVTLKNESRLYGATVEERRESWLIAGKIKAENAVQSREEEPIDDDEIKDSIHLAKQKGRRTRPPRKCRLKHHHPKLSHFEANASAEMGHGTESKDVQNNNLKSDKICPPNEKDYNSSPVSIGRNTVHSNRLEKTKGEQTNATKQTHKILRQLETQDSVEMEQLTRAHTKDFHPKHRQY